MNAYFFKMNQEEKKNILDQHKSIYNGYKTNYGMNSEQPLFVQDFANDKNGVTVSNKGNVSVYKNMNINESDASTGAKYIPDETFDFGGPDEYVPMEEQLDMIGDGEYDLPNGTVDIDDEYGFNDDFEMCEDDDFEMNLDDLMDLGDEENEIEEEEKEEILNKINESLDMFKRLKKYN